MGLKILVASAIISALTSHYVKCESFCWEKQSCGECIQTRGCSWCKMSAFEGPRCGGVELEKYNCAKEDIVSGSPESEGQEDRSRSTPRSSSSFYPPEYKVRLRVGEKINLTARFSFERKRSLDLYYLLDASCTMQKFRKGLTDLAGDLTTRLAEITKDIRLGFGSFIDKPVMPFISDPQDAVSGSVRNCDGIPMVETYGFRNYLPLSDDTEEFTQSVKNSHVSGNYDLPEGGLDALLQAAVCKKEIGWRDETLRIVVLATDDKSFHITGDGKVGGIIAPHDGNCYLIDKQGFQEYSMSTEFDYPSIALINDKLWENGIHAIFATPNTSLYTGLSSHVEGSSTVPLSKNQSGSIVEVVIQELQKIIDTVEIAEEQADTYRIRYYSKCHSSAEFVAGGKCNITGEASEDEHIIEYQVEIEVLKCPSRGAGPEESIEIGPIGFFSKLKIHLTPACSCSCETQPDVGQSPEFCLNGRSKCGQCDCSEGYCGKRCDKLLSNTTHAQCYRNELECSGNGTCHCGECYCQNEFMGSLCQFNRSQCPLGDDGRICSGRGICTTQFLNESMNIGIGSTNENEIIFCRCHPGFTGATCNCTSNTSNCRATPESSICSNNGDCKCNNCECRRGLQGKFCDECILADFEEKLSINPEFRTCMNTKFSDSKEAFSDISLLPCFSKHFPMPPIIRIVDDIPDSNCNRSMSPCRLEEYRHPTTDCKHQFSVNCNPENTSVFIIQWNQYGTECSGPKDLMGLFVGVATAIVIAGIVALIAWKIATHYYDKQEFLKFEKERANAQWPTENNPLYIATTTMHMNPSYGTDPEELGECETQE